MKGPSTEAALLHLREGSAFLLAMLSARAFGDGGIGAITDLPFVIVAILPKNLHLKFHVRFRSRVRRNLTN